MFAKRTRTLLGKKYVLVEGEITPRMARLINRYQSVHVCETNPSWRTLNDLLPWSSSLLRLVVTDLGIESVAAINHLTALEELDLFPGPTAEQIDFSCLPNLSVLGIDGDIRFVLPKGLHLQSLTVTDARAETILQIGVLENLVRLRLDSPKVFPGRVGSQVESLEISLVPWPGGDPIAGGDSVRGVDLVGIPGLKDLSLLKNFKDLSRLYIEDCPDLVSLSGVNIAKDASVIVVGNTPLRAKHCS